MKRRTKKSLAFLMSAAMLASAIAPTLAMAQDAVMPTFDAISDLHYTAGTVTDGVATKGLLLSKSDAILDAALAKSTNDILLITGDLTQNGTKEEHDHVAAKLAAHEAANPGKQIFVVPGEHDIQTTANPNAITKSDFAATYKNFGYEGTYTANLDYVKNITFGPRRVSFLMLNSVGADGNPALDMAYAEEQTKGWVKNGNTVVGVMHHPSVSRGGVDYNLMGLLYGVKGIKNAEGQQMWEGPAEWAGNPFFGLDLNDASSISYTDAQKLAEAGMRTFMTGHSMLMAYAAGSFPQTITNPDGTTKVIDVPWADYCNGSMVGTGAGVRTLTMNLAGTFDSAVNYVDTLADGSTVKALATAAYRAYMPTAVDDIVTRAEPVLIRALDMLKEVSGKAVDGMDISSFVPSIFQNLIKGPVKDMIGRILNDVKDAATLHNVLTEVKTALLNTAVPKSATESTPMLDVLTDVIVTLQHDNTQVSASLQPMVTELKAGTTDGLAAQAVRNFADELAKDCDSTLALINQVLNEYLQIGNKNTLRAMLTGDVQFMLTNFSLWNTLDGAITTNPDGTPISPEYKPSVLYKPLVERIFLMETNPASTALTADRFISGIKEKAPNLVKIALDGGLANII